MADADQDLVLLAEWQVSLYVTRNLPDEAALEAQARAQAALDESAEQSSRLLADFGATRLTVNLS